jgi:hypothetical protein
MYPLDQQTLIDADTAVEALIRAEGNVNLAAEHLHVPREVITASIAINPGAQESLNMQLRTLTTLYAFDTLRSVKALMDQTVVDLDPADRARLYRELTQVVRELTAPTQTNSANPATLAEIALRMLPPEARKAVIALAQSSDSSPATSVAEEEEAA